MPRGGARNRSGPPVDPKSGRSDRRGLQFVALPAEGFDGESPDFPLPEPSPREMVLWELVWTYPQAAQWAKEPWRHETIGMWVRWKARCEKPDASASDASALHRFADQIGLTPAGMKENGWVIAADEVATARAEKKAKAPSSEPPARRLRAVPGGGD